MTSLFAEGVSLDDSRVPEQWRQLFETAELTSSITKDASLRQAVFNIIERHGGPAALLSLPEDELHAVFAPATNLRKRGSFTNIGSASVRKKSVTSPGTARRIDSITAASAQFQNDSSSSMVLTIRIIFTVIKTVITPI